MIDAHDSALEQRPHIFDAVGVDVAARIGLSVIDGLVGEFRTVKPQVGSELICMDFGTGSHLLTDEVSKGLPGDIFDSLH